MNAASVAVPTVVTAAVLIPAMTAIAASGSSTRQRRRSGPSPSTNAISRSCGSMAASPAWAPRAIGSTA